MQTFKVVHKVGLLEQEFHNETTTSFTLILYLKEKKLVVDLKIKLCKNIKDQMIAWVMWIRVIWITKTPGKVVNPHLKDNSLDLQDLERTEIHKWMTIDSYQGEILLKDQLYKNSIQAFNLTIKIGWTNRI